MTLAFLRISLFFLSFRAVRVFRRSTGAAP